MDPIAWSQLVMSLLGGALGGVGGGGSITNVDPAAAGGVPAEQAPGQGISQTPPQPAAPQPEQGALAGPIQQAEVAAATAGSQPAPVAPPPVTKPGVGVPGTGPVGPPASGPGTGPAGLPGKTPASLGEILQAIAPALAGNQALFGGQDQARPVVAPAVGQNSGQALSARNPQIDIGRLLAALPGVR